MYCEKSLLHKFYHPQYTFHFPFKTDTSYVTITIIQTFSMGDNITESFNNVTTSNSTFQDHPTSSGLGTLIIINVLHAVTIIEAILALIGNSLAIVAVVRFPALQTPANILVVHLAIADLAGVPHVIMSLVIDLIGLEKSYWFYVCLAKDMNGLIGKAGNVYFICGMVFERYLAVMYPFRHQTMVTNSRVSLVCGITWICIVTFAILLCFFGNDLVNFSVCRNNLHLFPNVYRVGVCYHYIAITLVTIALHAHLWCTARKQARQIRALEMMFGRRSVVNHRMTRTVGIVLGTYLALTVPVAVISTLSNTYVRSRGEVPTGFRFLDPIMQKVWYANSFVNPWIYAFRHESFRNVFWRRRDGI